MQPITVAPENDAARCTGEVGKCHLTGTVLHMTWKGSCQNTILSTPEVNFFVTLLKKIEEVPWIAKIRGGYISDVVGDSFPVATATLPGP